MAGVLVTDSDISVHHSIFPISRRQPSVQDCWHGIEQLVEAGNWQRSVLIHIGGELAHQTKDVTLQCSRPLSLLCGQSCSVAKKTHDHKAVSET